MKKPGLIIFFGLLASFSMHGQTAPSADELFKNAREAAFDENNYPKAKEIAYQALAISPAYTDIEIFLGRVYTWDKQYDSAEFHLSKALTIDSSNEDANVAFTDLEYWNDHYEKALQICNKALVLFPASEALLIRKAKILKAEENYKEAGIVVGDLLKEDPNNKEAFALSSSLKQITAKNQLKVSYENSSFDKQYDKAWNLASVAYGRNTKMGTIIARLNYANRFSTNGLQGELDAYPHISKIFSAYMNFGYSDNAGVFPNFRAGLSLYANLPKSYVAEAGMRYLYFTRGTDIYTASLWKYYKKFLFTARTYIVPANESVSKSYSLAARYYLKGGNDYVGLTLSSGVSPDDNSQNILFNNKQNNLSTTKISFDCNHSFLKWNKISLSAGLIHQEYLPSVTGNQFDISAGISHRF